MDSRSSPIAFTGARMLQAILLAAVMTIPVVARAQDDTNVDYDEDADFSAYKTFALKAGTPATNPLMDKRIIEGIKENLALRGLKEDETDPGVTVSYHGSTAEEFEIDTDPFGYRFGPRWRWGPLWPSDVRTTVRKYTKGTLVVDLWDAKTKQLVWRGTATGTVSEDPEKNRKRLDKALQKLFKKFPPEKEG